MFTIIVRPIPHQSHQQILEDSFRLLHSVEGPSNSVRSATMLPTDSMVASGVGQSTGRPGVAGVARLSQQASSTSSRASRAAVHQQGFGGQPLLVPSSSQPRPIPSSCARAQRGASAAVLEAPTQASHALGYLDLGYPRDIEAKWEWGKELGKGGNGVVREVTSRAQRAASTAGITCRFSDLVCELVAPGFLNQPTQPA